MNKQAKNVICISSYLENYYRKQGCNTVIIPNVVDSFDPKWIKAEEYCPSRVRTFTYVGAPGKTVQKDRIDLIVAGFSAVKKKNLPFEFDIVGIEESTYVKLFEEQIEVIDYLGDRITFHGRKTHREAIEHLKKSDFSIFVRMSNRHTNSGFPTKLSESFACGTPVIATSTSDISEYLVDEENGFLCKEFSANALEQCIEKAINMDTSSLVKMHERCSKENPLDFRKFVDRLKMFMSKLL